MYALTAIQFETRVLTQTVLLEILDQTQQIVAAIHNLPEEVTQQLEAIPQETATILLLAEAHAHLDL